MDEELPPPPSTPPPGEKKKKKRKKEKGEEDEKVLIQLGYNYLLFEEKASLTYKMLNIMLKRGYQGLILSTTFPEKLKREHGLEGADLRWVTDTSKGDDVLSPKRLDFEVSREISSFTRDNEKPLILVDGIEYLILENEFDKILKFLKKMNDVASTNHASIIVCMNPEALDSTRRTIFQKEFDVVENLIIEEGMKEKEEVLPPPSMPPQGPAQPTPVPETSEPIKKDVADSIRQKLKNQIEAREKAQLEERRIEFLGTLKDRLFNAELFILLILILIMLVTQPHSFSMVGFNISLELPIIISITFFTVIFFQNRIFDYLIETKSGSKKDRELWATESVYWDAVSVCITTGILIILVLPATALPIRDIFLSMRPYLNFSPHYLTGVTILLYIILLTVVFLALNIIWLYVLMSYKRRLLGIVKEKKPKKDGAKKKKAGDKKKPKKKKKSKGEKPEKPDKKQKEGKEEKEKPKKKKKEDKPEDEVKEDVEVPSPPATDSTSRAFETIEEIPEDMEF